MLKELVLLTLLLGCSAQVSSSICPDLIHYTVEDQKQLSNEIKDYNNLIYKRQRRKSKKITRENYRRPIINTFITDYGNIREQIRICQK